MVDRLGKLQELGAESLTVAIDGKTQAEWRRSAEAWVKVFEQFPDARTDHKSAA
jgi:hypothetical protein